MRIICYIYLLIDALTLVIENISFYHFYYYRFSLDRNANNFCLLGAEGILTGRYSQILIYILASIELKKIIAVENKGANKGEKKRD